MELKDLISIDPETLGGQTVFKGTRVPIETLFDHLEAGISLEEFLDDFPTVTKDQALALIANADKLRVSKNFNKALEAGEKSGFDKSFNPKLPLKKLHNKRK